MSEKLYMCVTNDIYELPLCISNNIAEVAKYAGVTTEAVKKGIYKHTKGESSRFRKVVLNE